MTQEKSESHSSKVVYDTSEPNGLAYAREKLGVAVWKLATGTGSIKARLADEFIELVDKSKEAMGGKMAEDFFAIYPTSTNFRGNLAPKL